MSKQHEHERVKAAVKLTYERLGQSIICQECGATCETMGDVCNNPLDVACDGFLVYDATRTKALHDVGFFGRKRTL